MSLPYPLPRAARRLAATAAAVLACLGAPAQAEEETPTPLGFGVSYVADALHVPHGGLERGGGLAARADAWVDLDGTAWGIDALSAHVDLVAVHGPMFSNRWVGDAQGISSVQAPSRHHVYEAWLRWRLTDNAAPLAMTAKAGLIDLNSEFDVQSVASLFVHASHGIGPEFSQSGPNGPSIYPMTAGGIVVTAAREGGIALRLGVFDALAGSADDDLRPALRLPGTTGALLVGEVEVPLGRAEIQAGVWHFTRPAPFVDQPGDLAPSRGAYALVEGPLAPQWTGWVRTGMADARSNPIAWYIGTGVVREAGPWQIGLAMAQARLSARARAPGVTLETIRAHRHETSIELTAARAVATWLTLQPEAQYVIHTGWNPDLRNALVLGLRIKLGWSR